MHLEVISKFIIVTRENLLLKQKKLIKLKDLTEISSDVNKKLRQIFGTQFPKKATAENRTYIASYNQKSYKDTEEFIEDYFAVDIES